MISTWKKQIVLSILCTVAAAACFAKPEWILVSRQTAGGGAKEVKVSMTVSHVRIVCKTGSVILNTVVIREGDKKDTRKVVRTLAAGEEVVLDLGGSREITGLRISDGKSGRYEVYVKPIRARDLKKLKKKKWTLVDKVKAGGEAKELKVTGQISQIKIRSLKGSIIINTVVIRDGARKTAVPVAGQFKKGEEHIITLDAVQNVTGLRISDGGRGKYGVYVQ